MILRKLTRKQRSKRIFIGLIFSFFMIIFLLNMYLVFIASLKLESLIIENGQSQTGLAMQVADSDLHQHLEVFLRPDGSVGITLKLDHKNKSYNYPKTIDLNFINLQDDSQNFQLTIKKNRFHNIYNKVVNFSEQQKGKWNIQYYLKTLQGESIKFTYRVVIK